MKSIRLGETQQQLLDRLLANGSAASHDRIPRRPRGVASVLPSFGQQRLWFIDQLQPGQPMYTMIGLLALPAPCDAGAVRRALDHVLRRHESLRTVFHVFDDAPRQVIFPSHPVVLAVTDVRGADGSAAAELARRVVQRESNAGFDLAAGPLFRAHLVRLPGEHELLVYAVHHIASDGWSMTIIRRELNDAYRAFAGGQQPRNDEPPLQYADFALWQREHLQGAQLETLRAFWRDALLDAPPLSIPATDFPPPAEESGRGANRSFALSADLVTSLDALARAENATLFMLLLAGFAALLHRHGGQCDWVIGTPVANRDRLELEGVVGFLVNTLPLRVRLSPEMPFRALLTAVRDEAIRAFAHQSLPFDQIVDAVQPQRNLAHNPLFQVMFALQNLGERASTPGDVPERGCSDPEACVARFALALFLAPENGRLVGSIEYSVDLYEHERIALLIEQYRTILSAIIADPDRAIGELRVLSDEEARRVESWSAGEVVPRSVTTLHEIFARTRAALPDAPAVADETKSWTYAELDRRAGAIAAMLRSRGVMPGDRVAIRVSRDARVAVAVLGVLQAGAAGVPIDSALPPRRVDFILANARVRLLLDDALLDDAPDAPRPDSGAAPLAYVLYTSGSTGTPKGVAMPHRAIANLVEWQAAQTRDGVAARTSLFAPLGFDVAFQELFSTWASGGCVMVVPADVRTDPEAFGAWLAARRVTRTFVPPVMLRELAAAAPPELRLRELIVAGEALQVTPAVAALCARGGTALINQYGPTETHVATSLALRGDPSQWAAWPPIGRPIANGRASVLDERLAPVPIGVPGELVLGGTMVADGYFDAPELTRERFVPDPNASGARMYRTGDRARWRTDGTLEFLGRADDQLKIRGYRVEPGEIEGVLRAHPSVNEAAVVARNGTLLAFLESAEEIEVSALRAYLRDRLPEYMLPAAFVPLAHIPRSANGKIDRRALPTDAEVPRRATTPPRDEHERRIAAVWAHVLGVADVGIDDDFFDLGGHSLLAAQAVARMRRELNVELSVRDLFQAPTIAALAPRLRTRGAVRVENVPVEREELLVERLSFAQERLWFLNRLAPGESTYNIGQIVRFDGVYDAAALEEAWRDLTLRHPSLRTRFEARDDGAVQIVGAAVPLDAPHVDLEEVAPAMREAELNAIRGRERRIAFDLTAAPPVRGVVVRIDASEHALVLTLHHILADGWSLNVIDEELRLLYDRRRGRSLAPLAPPPLSYIEFARQQRRELEGEALQRQVEFWRRALAGAPEEMALPYDRVRTPEPFGPGAVQSFRVEREVHGSLLALSRAEGASLFMVLFAAFAALLQRYSGEDDLLVGTPVANRNRVDIERTVGFFVNTLVLRARTTAGMTFRELVRAARDTTLDALAHQELPFERLVEEVHPARDAGRHPLFQVMFFLNNLARPDAANAEIVADEDDDRLHVREADAKFDLTLGFEETPAGLAGAWEYRTDCFAHGTVWRMTRYLERLLAAVASSPDSAIDAIDLMTADERHFATVEANRAPLPPVEAETLHALVELRAKANPGALALEHGARGLTYAELWQSVQEIARTLRAAGVVAGDIVAVMLPRSPEWIATVVAVMAAEAAYLPIDILLPEARVETMLAHAQWLVTAEGVRATGNARRTADGAAYVIFTSGSTGEPRGVVVEHRSAVRYIAAAAASFGLDASARVLQFSSPSFDVSIEEIFTALWRGAALVLRSDDMLDSASGFLAACARLRLTTLILPTAWWHELVPEIAAGALPPEVRLVVIGGEQADGAMVDRFRAAAPDVRLLNAYGPTEATISATHAELWREPPGQTRPPIGRPVGGATVHILDRTGRPTPIGIPGELFIGGSAVARGYLGHDAATAERFLGDPPIYRTGDRVLMRGDGQLEFRGRIDDQVKVRGFRIELGEVEAALRAIPGVVEAGVAVSESGSALVAVAEVRDSLSGSELRRRLTDVLPASMVPAIITTAAVPKTVTGKIDRRAIAALAAAANATTEEPPRDEREAAIASIWSAVLRVPSAGIHDDFFDLGGHSLLAVQVVSRVQERFGIECSVRTLFETRTIARFAAALPTAPVDDGADKPADIIPRRAAAGPAPASFAQERLWFLDRIAPGVPIYNLPAVIPFRGPLNPAALRGAVRFVIERHESLRTRFAAVDGRPVQIVEPAAGEVFAFVDLCDVAPSQRDEEVNRIIAAEARHAFDLARGPLLRALLVRAYDDEHLLLVTLHHIVSDGWSMDVLRRELAAAYEALAAGRAPDLAPLTVQYADYAVWQRERLTGARLEELLAYWTAQLSDAKTEMPLPLDRPRPAERSYEGHWQLFTIPAPLVRRLERLGRAEGASLFMVLLTAFQLLLARFSRTTDVVVGTAVAGRDRVATEDLIGFFVNTLPIRTRIELAESFRSLLARVRGTVLGAFAHQELPFERLVEAVQPQRSISMMPLVQVVLALQNLPTDTRRAVLSAPAGFIGACTAKYDLSISLDAREDGALVGYTEYSSEIFEDATIARLLASFERLLAGAAASPDTASGALPILTKDDRALLDAWSVGPENGDADSMDGDIVAAVRRWARTAPHAAAAEEGSEILTYGELERRAAALASVLASRGCDANSIVALRLPRSIAYVVAAVAVEWTGAAYLPIDPDYPAGRVDYILEDSGARVLVALEDDAFLSATGIEVVSVARDGTCDGPPPLTPLPWIPARPEQTAYVIYTSGSTGRPKGVAVPHRGIRNLARSYRQTIRLGANDRCTLTASPGFDASVAELWSAIHAGAALAIPDDETRTTPSKLAQWLADRRITVSFLVTPLAEAMFAELLPAHATLRWILTGGDRLLRRPPAGAPYRLLNQYGPTECSVCATAVEVAPDGIGAPSIGKPIGGARVYILDEDRQPVPPGVMGEIYLGGTIVGRGYWKRPDLTESSFVPDPFIEGARMYRTGDYGRWREGEIEFLGRGDRQVKLRGFRIDLGEIEAVLTEAAGVPAVVRVSSRGTLIAYTAGCARDASTVLAEIRDRLPAYMVPARLQDLESFPMTPHGKIDVAALPDVDGVATAPTRPLNAIEERLAGVWRDVLRVPAVAASDDFFSLGGHSLLLTQLASRIRASMDLEMPLRALFESSSLEAMGIEVLVRSLESMPPADSERAFAAAESFAMTEKR